MVQPLEQAQSRREQAEATIAAVAQAIADNPDATQQQIAEQVGLKSQGYVSEIIAEISAKSEPKLLKHGGNMAEQPDYNKVGKDYGTNADYILARHQA